MPTYPLSRDNAWKAWTQGNVKGVNASLSAIFADRVLRAQDTRTGKEVDLVSRERVLANQAISQGMNVVRVWLTGWTLRFSFNPADLDHVVDAGATAPAGRSGWDSTTPLSSYDDPTVNTLAAFAAVVTDFLDQCQRLGLGVIFTCYTYDHTTDGRDFKLWSPPGSLGREYLGLFWAEVVKKWGKHPALVGLDILNEPGPPAPIGPSRTAAAWRSDPQGWCTLAQDVVNKVRAAERLVGVTTPVPIVVEVPGGPTAIRAFDGTPGVGGAPIADPADRIVYSFHHYDPWPLTHQGIWGDNWVNLGRVYGKSVTRGVEGGFDVPYDSYAVFGDGWGRAKGLVRDVASLEQSWQDVIDFRNNALAAGKQVAIYVGEFAHVQPEVDQVEPVNPGRAYVIDPNNGVPAFRVAEESERYRHPVFSPEHLTGGWKRQNPSRWVTRFEPFTAPDGQQRVRLYFDNLDRLLFGRTSFNGPTAAELGSLINNVRSGTPGGRFIMDPEVPSPRPDAVLTKICRRDPVTGSLLRDQIDRAKLPLKFRYAQGFPITTKLAEPDDDRPDQNALHWPIEKFTNTLLMTVVGPEGEIIRSARVSLRLDQFWVEVDATEVLLPAYRQAVEIDPNLVDGYFNAKAVAVFSSATPPAEMEAGRDQFIADTLAVCRKHRFSWSFMDTGNQTIGPIGWRASTASMRRLKNDCET